MVTLPPVAPDVTWFTAFFKSFIEQGDSGKAITEANKTLSSLRDYSRYRIQDSKGEPLVLSMALEGGGRKLRNLYDDLRLSEHGNWRRVHMGALEASLGKKPFYRHLEMPLRMVYQDKKLDLLEEFNLAIFKVLISFLLGEITPSQLKENNDILTERGKEIANKIKPEISLLYPLAEFGRETLLGLLAMIKE
ncbi:MAG: WbqC family protein [Muribaculaceae bacterium]|nr:WbqC family protein [Muribaculaceae bacterium]